MPKSSDESWQQFVQANQENLSPHIQRIIYNLTLLHKSKEETLIHQMQLQAQEESFDDDFDDSSTVASHDFIDLDVDLDDDENFSADVEQAISNPIEFNLDFYSREGLDAFRDNRYLNTALSQCSQSISDDIYP